MVEGRTPHVEILKGGAASKTFWTLTPYLFEMVGSEGFEPPTKRL